MYQKVKMMLIVIPIHFVHRFKLYQQDIWLNRIFLYGYHSETSIVLCLIAIPGINLGVHTRRASLTCKPIIVSDRSYITRQPFIGRVKKYRDVLHCKPLVINAASPENFISVNSKSTFHPCVNQCV